MHDTVIINIPIQKTYVRHLSGERFGIVGDLHMYGVKTACEIRFDPTTGSTSYHALKHPFESLPIPYADFCRILAMIAPWLVGFTFIGTGSFVVRNL